MPVEPAVHRPRPTHDTPKDIRSEGQSAEKEHPDNASPKPTRPEPKPSEKEDSNKESSEDSDSKPVRPEPATHHTQPAAIPPKPVPPVNLPKTCPACGGEIRAQDVSLKNDGYHCPYCDSVILRQ
jgi:formylmethanofuran dehydrogenase subunit E